MNLLKKLVSVGLSILMVLNFTFSHALEKNEKLPNKEEESSLVSYVIAGAVGVVAGTALALGGIYFLGDNSNNNHHTCCNGSVTNMPPHIRAIHWKKNLCWWISSMLYLYYHTDFKNTVLSVENRARTNNINENEQYYNELLVLKDLQDIFDALDKCEGNVCGITCDKNEVKKYINHLNSICGDNVGHLEYGRFGDVVYGFVAMAMQNLGFNSTDILDNEGVASFRCDDQSYFVGIINLPGNHFFITLTPVSEGAVGYVIGRNYKNDINAIESYSKVELENMKEDWDKKISKFTKKQSEKNQAN